MGKGKHFVLDCSIAMAWCFADEITDYTEDVLEKMQQGYSAIVPTIWTLEVSNVLLMAERKKRLKTIQTSEFIASLNELPIYIDNSTPERAQNSILTIAREQKITVYDAAYLELAFRERLPLASLDKELIKAAKSLKIKSM